MRKPLIGILGVIGIFLFTYQGVVPFVRWFLDTELADKIFYTNPVTDNKDRGPLALTHCQTQAQGQVEDGAVMQFHTQEAKSFRTGNIYLVNSAVDLQKPNETQSAQYNCTCKMEYMGGDDGDPANWKLVAFSMNGGPGN